MAGVDLLGELWLSSWLSETCGQMPFVRVTGTTATDAAGQIVGRITEIRPVADVMAELVRETAEVLDRLHHLR